VGTANPLGFRVSEFSQTLAHPNNLHLSAADGWLGLGNWHEANVELDQIDTALAGHPKVLELRYKVCAASKQWDRAVEVGNTARKLMPEEPWGHFYAAYALHELKRTQEAYDIIKPVIGKFPAERIMCYNLACYACQLGKLEEAMEWFQKTILIPGKENIRDMALSDKDLEPLWQKIEAI